MYLKYADFTKGKSSVFISHRLASTRFCDRIIMIENGTLTETGTTLSLWRRAENTPSFLSFKVPIIMIRGVQINE